MNNPIYCFYLAAKHSNMFMAIQISKMMMFLFCRQSRGLVAEVPWTEHIRHSTVTSPGLL